MFSICLPPPRCFGFTHPSLVNAKPLVCFQLCRPKLVGLRSTFFCASGCSLLRLSSLDHGVCGLKARLLGHAPCLKLARLRRFPRGHFLTGNASCLKARRFHGRSARNNTPFGLRFRAPNLGFEL